MVPGLTLGSFGPRPKADAAPEPEEIVVNGAKPKPTPTSGLLAGIQISPVSLLNEASSALEDISKDIVLNARTITLKDQ